MKENQYLQKQIMLWRQYQLQIEVVIKYLSIKPRLLQVPLTLLLQSTSTILKLTPGIGKIVFE